jgi:hypothetical protein
MKARIIGFVSRIVAFKPHRRLAYQLLGMAGVQFILNWLIGGTEPFSPAILVSYAFGYIYRAKDDQDDCASKIEGV